MGLYDREWFWEGYEERHGINKKPTPSKHLKNRIILQASKNHM